VAAANKRIATLEAENRRLREELTELRARIAERPAPAPAPGAGQAALELYGARRSGRGGAQRSEPASRVRARRRGDRRRPPARDHRAAAGAALGPEVDDPVTLLHDVEVVLDGDHGVAEVDQPVQPGDQPIGGGA